ncbi:reverse transcriptase domain-containing protein [Tanacetum coccineum]
MGITEDVVVRVDGFTFLADFIVVNFKPDPRVPIILGRPFLRTAKALIDLYEEKLTLRVGNDELVFYADKSEKNKNKEFAHAISIIDFSKDEQFSSSTTIHSDALLPSSSLVKTSVNLLEEFTDEFTLPNPFPPGNNDSILKKDVHKENFQIYSNSLFEFEDNFNSNNENPLFNEMEEDVENSKVFDEPFLPHTPFSDKVECFDPRDDNDKIDAFLAIESDPLHHEFTGKLITIPPGIFREHEDYINRMSLLCGNSSSQSPENFYTIIESLPISTTRIEDSNPNREEIDIFSGQDDSIPPGVESDFDSEEDIIDNLLNNDSTHERLTFNIEPNAPVINNVDELNKDECFDPGGGEINVEVNDSFTFVT